MLLECAVLLSYADGDPSEPEVKLIDVMVGKLGIPADQAEDLRKAASARALRFIDSLSHPNQPKDSFYVDRG